MIIMMSRTARTGSATRKTSASVELIRNARVVANTSITGLRPNGRIPVDTAFWILVTSLVSLVTNDETLKWSILENE